MRLPIPIAFDIAAPARPSRAIRHPLRGGFCVVLFLAGCSTASSISDNNADWTTLRSGETFYRVAQRNNRPTLCLQRYNPSLQANALTVGQRVLVPTAEECASLDSARMRYRVRKGDTLYSIANHFEQPPQSLAAANPALPKNPRLEIGQWLTLPYLQRGAATQSSQPAPASSTPQDKSTTTHVAAIPPAPAALPNDMKYCRWPLQDPRVIREFGPDDRGRLQPMMLATRTSQTAIAITDGRVQFANTMRQLGHVIVVHHAHDIQTVYAHCGSLNVRAGQQVQAGTPLCQVAQDDATASPQLLFDVRQSGHPIDPRRLLK